MRAFRTVASCLVLAMFAASGCGPGEADARCRIDAGAHNRQIAKSVAKSKLWRAYFEHMTESGALVEITVEVDRRTRRSYGGDYDGGTVTFNFDATSLKHRRRLYDDEGTFEIDSFLVGNFDKDATREEMQEVAFRDAEKEAYPYLDMWVNVAAVKAMALEDDPAFVPVLEKVVNDTWAGGPVKGASREALAQIRGG